MKMKVVVTKLRLALGSFKDQASIGKAMISGSDIFSTIEVAIVRATGHDDAPIDEKNVHEILFLVSNSPGSVAFLAERISHRLSKTSDRIVTLKILLLVHRLMRGGDRNFEQELRSAHLSGNLQLNLYGSPLSSDSSISFLGNYVAFLEERMGWVINQAGKLEPIMSLSPGFRFHEDKSIEIVFYRLPRCQALLDRIMGCLPPEISHSDRLSRSALVNILRESFQVYVNFCECATTLVDSFFDLNKAARALALDIFKRASCQSYKFFEFLENCKRITGTKSLDYPLVRIITTTSVASMEEFLISSQAFGNDPLPSTADSFSPTSVHTTHQTKVVRSDAETIGEQVIENKYGTSDSPFPRKLETKISTVWVQFDEDDSPDSCFSMDGVGNCYPGISDDRQSEWCVRATNIDQREALQLL